MLKVIYYTAPPFLDTAIEIINVLKKQVELYVVIEIAPTSKNSTIINVDKLPEKPALVEPEQLLNKSALTILHPYLQGVKSVLFIVHPNDKGISFSTLKASKLVLKHIRTIKPDVIHLDAKSLRFISMVPYLLAFKKVYATIHDPAPHSGEENFKSKLIRYLALATAKEYFFYSVFSKNQFDQCERNNKKKRWQLRFYPLTFYRAYGKNDIDEKKHVLFFGRLSPYKGLDTLLDAIPEVFASFPNQNLIIAGKSIEGYQLDEAKLKAYEKNVQVMNRYIPNEELAQLIRDAKMIVCPYKDATQSGVLMAALALEVPVIATSVGSFPEYIENEHNGKLVPVNNAPELANAIKQLLMEDYYKALSKNIQASNELNQWEINVPILLKAYQQ